MLAPKLYTHRHEGAALVVGYAPSVHAEVAQARRLRPGAALLGVKYAAVLFREIEHVWTQHVEQADDIREKVARRIFIHSRKPAHQRRWLARPNQSRPDYYWPSLSWVNGGSGFAAGLWARHGMGFEEVILCGVPLEPGGYAREIGEFKATRGAGGSFVNFPALERWRAAIASFVAQGRTAGITSMGGWTRSVLGAPA